MRGNITSRKEYASDGYTLRSTDTYSYDNPLWKDQLTAYNGQAITYDAMGNPITYNGYTYTWDMGRRLKSISNGANTYSYTYDENGLRTSKTVNGETTNFIYQDSLLKAQYTEDYSMLFWYDENCSPIGFVYTDKTAETPTNETFIYKKNALGDILGFYNSQGELIAQYWYDEWGVWFNAVWDSSQDLYTFLLNNNPLLYRGYYYDLETRYYYLQSRYYNPEWGRFLNADDVDYIGATGTSVGVSTYSYCENNPINNSDYLGLWFINVRFYYNMLLLKANILSFGSIAGKMLKKKIEKDKRSALSRISKTDNFTGYIYGQGVFLHKNMEIGFGTLEDNGCGVIAVYNCMKKLGKRKNLGQIVCEFEINHALFAKALLGVTPGNINRYFYAHNVEGENFYKIKSFKKKAKTARVNIMCIYNIKGKDKYFHYFMFYYNKGKNKYIAYNWSNQQEKAKGFATFNLMIEEDEEFLWGYSIY